MRTHNYNNLLIEDRITTEYYILELYIKEFFIDYKFMFSPETYILILNCVKEDFVSKCNADIDYLASSCCHTKCKRMNNGKHERTGL
jgi:hypothetical protein